MKASRENLIDLLRATRFAGQLPVRLLRRFSARQTNPDVQSEPVEAFLSTALVHQSLLSQCLLRIDGTTEPRRLSEDENPEEDNREDLTGLHVSGELIHLRSSVLQQIELLSSVIDAAESTGFFETKLVCEGILTEKASLASKLAAMISVEDALSPAPCTPRSDRLSSSEGEKQ
ncbi:hypothetical protein E1N52_33520 [Paraburkholderia guartelaensis]|uniref:DUF892 family protein n=1 Tax=Paraburkholderia guartelaensis TaxID=2546446 RepID=A0A4R5L4V1_9BURK|nr:hypothetical protein [Paraburkholderia guartelaensis]TDG03700.1 hypothetical protein E1N52_33520 [Paraburkholderia guartelaensis]